MFISLGMAIEPATGASMGELLAALRAVQEEARRTGLDKMSMREIDAEVQAYRREQRAKGKSKRPAK